MVGTVKGNSKGNVKGNNKGKDSVDCWECDTLGKDVTTTPEQMTSSTKFQDKVYPSIQGDLVTHHNGDNMKRVYFDKFHGFPVTHLGHDDIEEAGRGRLHGDFIESQLDTCIHSSTDNGDNSVSRIQTFVSTNNPGVKNVKLGG